MVSCSTNCQLHSLGRTIFGCIVLCSVPLLHKGKHLRSAGFSPLPLPPLAHFPMLLPVSVLVSGIASGRCFVCRSSSSSTSSRTGFAVMMKPPYPSFMLVSQIYAYCVSSLEWCVPPPANVIFFPPTDWRSFLLAFLSFFSLDDLFDLNHHLLQSAGLVACRFVLRSGLLWASSGRKEIQQDGDHTCLSEVIFVDIFQIPDVFFPFACIWPPCLRATLPFPAF